MKVELKYVGVNNVGGESVSIGKVVEEFSTVDEAMRRWHWLEMVTDSSLIEILDSENTYGENDYYEYCIRHKLK